MPAYPWLTSIPDGCGIPSCVGCFALHGSTSHTPSRFPDLPLIILSPLLTVLGMQWDLETTLLAYSDRIVQEFHLIPSQGRTCGWSFALT